jgi:hypothetical protein
MALMQCPNCGGYKVGTPKNPYDVGCIPVVLLIVFLTMSTMVPPRTDLKT